MRGHFHRSLILTAAAVIAASAQSTSHPTFWRYSHPDAKALVGVDVKRVMDSPFGQRLAKEFEQAGFKARAQSEGADLISGVERVLISLPGQFAPRKPAGKTEKTPFVATLQGKFDLAKIRAFVKSQSAVKG
jgi:hypothetical protein